MIEWSARLHIACLICCHIICFAFVFVGWKPFGNKSIIEFITWQSEIRWFHRTYHVNRITRVQSHTYSMPSRTRTHRKNRWHLRVVGCFYKNELQAIEIVYEKVSFEAVNKTASHLCVYNVHIDLLTATKIPHWLMAFELWCAVRTPNNIHKVQVQHAIIQSMMMNSRKLWWLSSWQLLPLPLSGFLYLF